jgi:2'-5' RNA ligase
VRLFVALRPPPAAAAELAEAAERVRRAAPAALRWTRPEQWHLTLTFLGDVPESSLPELAAGLDAAATVHPPLPLRLGGAGRFGDRVLWVGLRDGRWDDADIADLAEIEPVGSAGFSPDAAVLAVLARLAASTTAAARAAGIRVDDKPFRPHLTLARAGGRVRPRLDLRPLVADLASFNGRSWMAAEFHLVHSTLGRGPDGNALHRDLAAWPLGGTRTGVRPVTRPGRPPA